MISNNFSRMVGERLLRLSKISEETGISRATLTSLYYKRSKGVNLDVLDKLCKYLGCNIGDILEYMPDENKGKEH